MDKTSSTTPSSTTNINSGGQNWFICGNCEYKTDHERLAELHQWKHEKLKDAQCFHCQKEFKTDEELDVHKKENTKVTDLTCDICGRTLVSACVLTRHRKVHEVENLTCRHCGTIFPDKDSLGSHIIESESKSELTCENGCDVIFSGKCHYELHRGMCTAERPLLRSQAQDPSTKSEDEESSMSSRPQKHQSTQNHEHSTPSSPKQEPKKPRKSKNPRRFSFLNNPLTTSDADISHHFFSPNQSSHMEQAVTPLGSLQLRDGISSLLDSEIPMLDPCVDDFSSEIDKQLQDLIVKNQDLVQQNTANARKYCAKISYLNEEISKKNHTISDQNDTISDQDDTIKYLRTQFAKLESRKKKGEERFRGQIRGLTAGVIQLEAQKRELESNLTNVTVALENCGANENIMSNRKRYFPPSPKGDPPPPPTVPFGQSSALRLIASYSPNSSTSHKRSRGEYERLSGAYGTVHSARSRVMSDVIPIARKSVPVSLGSASPAHVVPGTVVPRPVPPGSPVPSVWKKRRLYNSYPHSNGILKPSTDPQPDIRENGQTNERGGRSAVEPIVILDDDNDGNNDAPPPPPPPPPSNEPISV